MRHLPACGVLQVVMVHAAIKRLSQTNTTLPLSPWPLTSRNQLQTYLQAKLWKRTRSIEQQMSQKCTATATTLTFQVWYDARCDPNHSWLWARKIRITSQLFNSVCIATGSTCLQCLCKLGALQTQPHSHKSAEDSFLLREKRFF